MGWRLVGIHRRAEVWECDHKGTTYSEDLGMVPRAWLTTCSACGSIWRGDVVVEPNPVRRLRVRTLPCAFEIGSVAWRGY